MSMGGYPILVQPIFVSHYIINLKISSDNCIAYIYIYQDNHMTYFQEIWLSSQKSWTDNVIVLFIYPQR